MPSALMVMESVVREVLAVAAARGIQLDLPLDAQQASGELLSRALANVHSVLDKTAANTSSMLADVLKGRPTEIESINGAVVRIAEGLGIKTPANRILVELVKSVECTYGKAIA